MPRRRAAAQSSLMNKSFELSVAAPQVVAHRVQRMLTTGPVLSARDQKEFMGMGTEKVLAFWQSWAAMWMKSMDVQGRAWAAYWQRPFHPPQNLFTRQSSGMSQVLLAGIKPVHAKAVSNSKRLNRTSR